jgi:hypothetical protein
MTTITSDGKEYVYAVFGADGCECDSLEAIFHSQELADTYIANLRAKGDHDFYGNAELLEVRSIEVRKDTSLIESETHRRLAQQYPGYDAAPPEEK